MPLEFEEIEMLINEESSSYIARIRYDVEEGRMYLYLRNDSTILSYAEVELDIFYWLGNSANFDEALHTLLSTGHICAVPCSPRETEISKDRLLMNFSLTGRI